jgi:hypothetical protein
MEIGTVLLGVDSVVRQPGWHQIAAGVLVHQSADLFWAVIFFGAAGRWTARLPPIVLLFAGIPGAVGTSAPHEDHEQIPGMPSAAMMHQLEQLDGVELERQFFPVMMEHHRGAC